MGAVTNRLRLVDDACRRRGGRFVELRVMPVSLKPKMPLAKATITRAPTLRDA
jgi:hypothetical protein